MKKKSRWYTFARGKCANKIMKIMKLTWLLMFVFTLHLAAETSAQRVVNAKFSNKALKEVLQGDQNTDR